MLYSSNTPYSYTAPPTYIDAYGYSGGSSGYNRAAANSVEGAVSSTAGGILGNIPIISSFYNIGSSAYKGLKSTDSVAGDVAANLFAPHNQYFANLDNSIDLNKRRKRLQFVKGADGKMTYSGNQSQIRNYDKAKRKQDIKGTLSILDFILPGIGSSISAGIEGKQDRQAEQERIDYNKKLQNYYQQQTGMAIPAYQTQDATPYNSAITQGFMSGAMGLFDTYGGKKDKKEEPAQQMQDGGMPMDTTKMVYDPEIKVNTQGDNYNWSSGTYGFTDGGVAVVGGKGNDDIALVDTNNGEDTGVRVEKGEMLVISKDNVEAIEDALEKGDKESIYDIISRQFKEEPTEMGEGKEGYNGGGVITQSDIDLWKTVKYGDVAKNPKLQELAKKIRESGLLEENWKAGKFVGDVGNSGIAFTDDEILATFVEKGYDLNKFLTPLNTSTPKIEGGKQVTSGRAGRTDGRQNQSWLAEMYATPYDSMNDKAYNEQNASDLIYGEDVEVETEYPLLAESVYTSNVPASNGKFYDKLKGIDFGNLAGNAYDGYRFGLGLSNSQRELPRWTLPTEYLQYGQRLRSEADRGLTPEELSLLNTTADENSRYAMANVYNLASGNAGLALANIQNVGGNRMQDAIKINALDAERERANLANYGSFLGKMNYYDRQQFEDRLLQDERTKKAAAQLTQDAYKNMTNRADYNKAYGNNSLYSQLEQEYLKQRELETQAKENYKNYLLSK
jgi:hypothetical protein